MRFPASSLARDFHVDMQASTGESGKGDTSMLVFVDFRVDPKGLSLDEL